MEYFIKRYINRALYMGYIALAIVPSWALAIDPFLVALRGLQ